MSFKAFGYADIDGAYPGRPQDVNEWTNTYIAWAFIGYWKGKGDTTEMWLSRMKKCIKRAADLGMKIYLGLDCGRSDDAATTERIKAVLDTARDCWANVIAVDVADEPPWDKPTTKQMLAKVRGIIEAMGLDYRPCGITYTAVQSLTEDPITIPNFKLGKRVGPDYIVLELYSKPQNQGQAANLQFVKDNIKGAVARIAPDQRLRFWLAGYDRNGAFVGEEDIAALNWQTYEWTRNKYSDRIDGYNIFNWGRKTGVGGTLWLPKVRDVHKRIWADMVARKEVV